MLNEKTVKVKVIRPFRYIHENLVLGTYKSVSLMHGHHSMPAHIAKKKANEGYVQIIKPSKSQAFFMPANEI